jgi:hypothetical protein
MPNPQRDAGGHWDNDVPITDIEEALKVLNTSGGVRMPPPYLAVRETDSVRICEIVRMFNRKDGGGVEYFRVDPTLAQELAIKGFVVPDSAKVWGNDLPRDAYVLSNSALEVCQATYRGLADAARHVTRAFAGLNLNEEALMG